ncbi:MAG: hypothetical protein AAB459_02610, partial [Patescibacteria group bacterium]
QDPNVFQRHLFPVPDLQEEYHPASEDELMSLELLASTFLDNQPQTTSRTYGIIDDTNLDETRRISVAIFENDTFGPDDFQFECGFHVAIGQEIVFGASYDADNDKIEDFLVQDVDLNLVIHGLDQILRSDNISVSDKEIRLLQFLSGVLFEIANSSLTDKQTSDNFNSEFIAGGPDLLPIGTLLQKIVDQRCKNRWVKFRSAQPIINYVTVEAFEYSDEIVENSEEELSTLRVQIFDAENACTHRLSWQELDAQPIYACFDNNGKKIESGDPDSKTVDRMIVLLMQSKNFA